MPVGGEFDTAPYDPLGLTIEIRATDSRVWALLVDDRPRWMGKAEHQMRSDLEHPVNLAEHPVQILDELKRVRREDQVHRVSAKEGELRHVCVTELDSDLLLGAQLLGVGELGRRGVDPDHRRPSLRKGNGALGTAAPELDDPLTFQLTEKAKIPLGGDIRPVIRRVYRNGRSTLVFRREAVPRRGGTVGHSEPEANASTIR